MLQTDLDTNCPACPPGGETAALESHLRSRLGSRLQFLQILTGAGGLILRGRSPTYYVKQLAQHAVMQFTPVPILANEIRVE